MSNFNPLVTIEGIGVQVNYDEISFITANDVHSSLITFRGGGTLLVKAQLNMEWPLGNNELLMTDQ